MSEHDHQAQIVAWARMWESRFPELKLLYSTLNGVRLPLVKSPSGKMICPEAIRLKEEGMNAGVPDMHLPVARHGFHGLWIENKFASGTPSPEQVRWLEALAKEGHYAIVCWTVEEATDAIKWYLEDNDEDR